MNVDSLFLPINYKTSQISGKGDFNCPDFYFTFGFQIVFTMNPQFTFNNSGKPVGVFLSIEDWKELIDEHPDVALNSGFQNDETIPEWQMELGRNEIKNLKTSNDLIDWETGKKHLKF